MIYICPICQKALTSNDEIAAKHLLSCWKEQNPNHKSKPAPRSEDIVQKKMNTDIMNFFESFQKR